MPEHLPQVARAAPQRQPEDSAGKKARDRHDRIMLRRFAASHDPALRETLIDRFMPLARSLAWRYSWTQEPIEDLVQVASEGLVKAVDRYDPDRARAFSSYATPFILGTLRHYFRDATQRIHMPRSLQESVQKVSAATERAEAEDGHTPDRDELCRRTDLESDQVEEALVAMDTRRPASIDAGRRSHEDGDGDGSIAETVGNRDRGYDRVEATLAAEAVDLEHNEREALRLRFGHSLSQREIGEEIGTSQMQVSRLLRRALRKVLDAVQADDRGGPAPSGTAKADDPPEAASPGGFAGVATG